MPTLLHLFACLLCFLPAYHCPCCIHFFIASICGVSTVWYSELASDFWHPRGNCSEHLPRPCSLVSGRDSVAGNFTKSARLQNSLHCEGRTARSTTYLELCQFHWMILRWVGRASECFSPDCRFSSDFQPKGSFLHTFCDALGFR